MKPLNVALSLAAFGTAAFAADAIRLDGTVGIGAAVGAQRYNGSYGDNAMPYFRAHVEYHATEDLAVRAIGGFGNISDGSSRFRTEWFSNLGLEGVYQPKFQFLGNLRPYLASGVATDFGTAKHNRNPVFDLDWNFYMPVELGVEYLVTKNFAATAFLENRVHSVQWDKLDGVVTGDNYYDKRDELPRAGLGLTWRFGCKAPPAAVAEVVKTVVAPVVEKAVAPVVAKIAPVIDGDNDGVPDAQDKCSATPAGVKVNANGCPVDADNDGIADYLDKCPATPAGVKVNANGCPVDADNDGIADYLDKCPGTPTGTKVDSTGCVEIKFEKGTKLTLDGILFASGKSEIDPSSDAVLTHAADAIKSAPKAKIEIAGFTDNAGKAKTNLTLSGKRATSVKAYLVKLGVPAKQITAKGYGAVQPIADNKTEEGRAKNRRIEFRVK